MKAITSFIDVFLPVLLLAAVVLVSTGFILVLGWLFSLVTPLTMWQAVIITTVTASLSTIVLHLNLPDSEDILPLIPLVPLATVIFLLIMWPLDWLIGLVSPLSAWESSLLGVAMTMTSGYILLRWLGEGVAGEVAQLEEEDDDRYDDGADISDLVQALPEGRYLVMREHGTGDKLFMPAELLDPDAPCPCGSRRKFRNCHGQNQSQGQTRRRKR